MTSRCRRRLLKSRLSVTHNTTNQAGNRFPRRTPCDPVPVTTSRREKVCEAMRTDTMVVQGSESDSTVLGNNTGSAFVYRR